MAVMIITAHPSLQCQHCVHNPVIVIVFYTIIIYNAGANGSSVNCE